MRPASQTPSLASLSALILGLFLSIAVSAANAQTLPDVQRLMKQNQMPQALEAVDTYIATKPKDAQGRFLRGLILTEMGRSADAIAVFTKLTEDFPELPEPYNNLAVLYAQQKQYDKARTALEMAIRTHPSYSIAHENLGDVYAKLASQAYDKALKLDPKHGHSLFLAGAAAMERGDNKQGIAHWEALLLQVEPGSEIDQMLRSGIDKMKAEK